MPKKIVILADGTGNAFFKQESNVWRIFQALDTSAPDQIAFYIPGVGTSNFKPFALLDGATGIGVPSNVRKLHRFLSWNWEPEDEIYMFGFSRGAFTIRTLIDLVAKEGLLPREIEGEPVTQAEMRRYSKAAWRSYCRKDPVRKRNLWVKLGVRKIRDFFLWIARRLRGGRNYAEVEREIIAQGRDGKDVTIHFAGLFDTVEAYGVPIEELRTAIDRLLWPIAFGDDREISDRVACVRHALSLEDERTSFHPIRIDIRGEDPTKRRIEEIWFAGVHSDVGGGYPDASLAHVPLTWMLGEAKKAGLGAREPAFEELRSACSAFGPLHDSRAGLSILYRYHPRKIEKEDEAGNYYGRPVVHYAVAERMVYGSDNYAPITLPSDAEVYMPDESRYVIKGFEKSLMALQTLPATGAATPQAEQEQALARSAVERLRTPDQGYARLTLDLVWLRRVNYFVLLFSIVLFAALPAWTDGFVDFAFRITSSLSPAAWNFIESLSSGFANVISGAIEAIRSLAPGYVQPYFTALQSHPLIVIPLIIAILLLYRASSRLQDRIHDYARRAWWFEGRKGAAGAPRESLWTKIARLMRTSEISGVFHKAFANVIVPPLTLAVVLAPAIIGANRMFFNFQVGIGNVCIGTDDKRKLPAKKALQWLGPDGALVRRGWSPSEQEGFATSNPCWASGWAIEEGGAYRVSIEVRTREGDQPWFDQTIMTDTHGFDSDSFWLALSTVLRRWPSAGWFQPVARIGAKGDAEWPLVPIEKSGAIPSRGEKCTRMPIRYEQTEEYCKVHRLGEQACEGASLDLAMNEQLPEAELATANAAWEQREFRRGDEKCSSVFPRTKFVSDFVAHKTGELFLFVNDAVFFPTSSAPQAFYTNNRGTATVTLERFPVAPSVAAAGSEAVAGKR